jgi:hypothetical protein
MSKGSPLIALRLPGETLAMLDQLIEKNNRSKRGEPWTRSSWLRDCIIDKVFHQFRARFRTTFEKVEVHEALIAGELFNKDS